MTKLEQNPMSSSKGMQWAPPINDLSLGPLSYSTYSQNYPGAPPAQARHNPSSSHPPPSSAGTNASGSSSGPSVMKSPVERGPEGEQKAPKKKPGASSKKPEVPPGLEHFHSKYPKPTHSYSLLITTAILESAQNQMTLNEIYEWVMDRYPWYRTAINGWKNSIRHNLSLNKAFMRVPRPPSEPGKGSYWKLDPNHQTPLDPHNGAGASSGGGSRSNRNSRRSSAGQRSSSGKGGSRRATSDPTPHQLPPGSAPEIPLTPVPMLPKRPGQENDPYVFKVDTPPVPSIVPAMPSSASRRHSHLLSHDHSYSSPQEQLQHIAQQQQQEQQQQQPGGPYGSHMAPSFGLSGLNPQHHHQGALFSPTSPTGSGVSGEYGSPNSFYTTNNGTSSHGLSNTSVMDPNSDSASFSRFSSAGLYFPNGNSPSGSLPSASRPLSMPASSPYGGGNNSHYDYSHTGQHGNNNTHPYGHMNQGGGSGAQFYTGSVNYGFPTSNRGGANGGPNPQGYGSQSYRSAHDYNNTGSSDYSNGGHSRPSSMMNLSSPTGSSFVSPTSSSSSNSYSMSQSFGQGPSGMLSPISPGSHGGPNSALSLPTSSPSSSSNMRQQPNSIVIPQDSKSAPNSASNGGGNSGGNRNHSGW